MRIIKGKGSFKDSGEHNKIGRDFKEVVLNYSKFTTKAEYLIFVGLPLVISVIVFLYLGYFEKSNIKILQYILEMNQNSLSVVAILAGFNTTSLAIIAASNNKVLKYLKNQYTSNSSSSILKQLISFFSFAILFQLMILIIGIILSMISSSFTEVASTTMLANFDLGIPLLSFGCVWLFSILFSIIISIRNATLLYRYVIFIADYSDEK